MWQRRLYLPVAEDVSIAIPSIEDLISTKKFGARPRDARRLSPEEFAARVAAPWSEQESEDFEALIAWFNQRYPTPMERLRAIRHLAAQWQRNRPR